MLRLVLNHLRRSRGFNLVEVVIALGLVVMAGAGGVAVFAVAVNSQSASQITTDASNLAQGELQKLRTGDPERVALNEGQYTALMADGPTRVQWEQHLGGEVMLRAANGTVAPHQIIDNPYDLTVMRYVTCDTPEPTCMDGGRPAARVARVVVEGPKGARVELAARIGNPNVGASPPARAPPPSPRTSPSCRSPMRPSM